MKKEFLAEFVSLALGPLTILVIMPFIIVIRQTANLAYALEWEIFSLFFILTGFLLFLYGRAKGYYSDFDISKRKERARFYVTTLILSFIYFAATALIKGFSFHLTAIIFSTFLIILTFTLANHFIKASIHLGIVCAFVLAMGLFYGINVFIPLFFLIPLMAWSRLHLKKHSPKELLVGATLGSFMTVASFLIWKFLL
jgi:membrane-associated phospholipid phosphatase